MKYIPLFALLAMLFACNTSSSMKNMPADRDRAFWFCSAFDSLRQLGDNARAEKMLGEELPTADLEKIFFKLDSAVGKITDWQINSYSSDVETRNGVEYGEYTIAMKAKYERGNVTENFSLTSGADHIMHIAGFHANIDL